MFRIEAIRFELHAIKCVVTMDKDMAEYHTFLKEAFENGYVISKIKPYIRLTNPLTDVSFCVDELGYFNDVYRHNNWDFESNAPKQKVACNY